MLSLVNICMNHQAQTFGYQLFKQTLNKQGTNFGINLDNNIDIKYYVLLNVLNKAQRLEG